MTDRLIALSFARHHPIWTVRSGAERSVLPGEHARDCNLRILSWNKNADHKQRSQLFQDAIHEFGEGQHAFVTTAVREGCGGVPGRAPPAIDTRVTVELREIPGGTEVILTHAGLQSKDMRGSNTGWSSLLESIEKLLVNK